MTDTAPETDADADEPAAIGERRLRDLCALVGSGPDPELRAATVETLSSVAEAAPERFDAEHLRALSQGLPGSHGAEETTRPGETRLTYVFYAVAEANPTVVEPVVNRVTAALFAHARAFHNTGAMANLSFPVGAVLADAPDALGQPHGRLVGSLFRLSDADDEYARQARHSLAWAVERRALAHPEATAQRWSRLKHVVETEDHQPALKHLARLVAHLERALLGLAAGVEPQVAAVRHSDTERVAVAGCMALGALGSETAVSALETMVAETDSRRVHTAGRRALREAMFPRETRPARGEPLSANTPAAVADRVDPGDWLWVEPQAFPARTGQLRARLDAVDGPPDGWRFELTNPYEGYDLTLTGPDGSRGSGPADREDGDRLTGLYADRRQSGTMPVRPAAVGTVADDLLPLVYALPDDRLSFTVEKRSFQAVVTDVDHGPDGRRIRCRDRQRGRDVEFRPCSRHPRMALFDPGRALPAAEFDLSPRESPPE